MSDLRPYVCTVEECSQSNEYFSTVKDYLNHVVLVHELQDRSAPARLVEEKRKASIKCLFCGQQTTEGRGQGSRAWHVGSHMEEIAFIVVPRAYEGWDFYSDSSSSDAGIGASKEPDWNYPTWKAMTYDTSPNPQKTDNRNSPPYRCDRINPSTGKACKTYFSRSYDLTRHEDSVHKVRKTLQCHYCIEKKTFSRGDAFTRHMRVVHPAAFANLLMKIEMNT